jgi:DNA primase
MQISRKGNTEMKTDVKKQILENLDIKKFYLAELPSLKSIGSDRGQALCPFHEDKKPSLSVNFKTGYFKCFGCERKGSIFDYYKKKHGVNFRAAIFALSSEAGLTDKAEISKTYDYVDESGNFLFQVVRYKPKRFSQRRRDGDEGWINNIKGVLLVPYNLPDVLKAKSVIIVEGEKDADNLHNIGLVGTCNPMGAGKWRTDYNQYFKGKKVAIIPDNDSPGKKHATAVAKHLKYTAESVKIVEIPGVQEHGDISI